MSIPINLGMPEAPPPVLAPRRATRKIKVGSLYVGGDAPVSVQSMTTTKTTDINATLQQIAELTASGCDIVRVACPTEEDALALPIIARKSQIPVIADIHFQPRYVFAAIDAGCAAVRVNPGNIKKFDDKVGEGNSVLRVIHYPPLAPGTGGVRAGAHEDINVITLLLGAEEGGLELLDRGGRWLPVNPPPGTLVCNVGDMLQRLTNHVLPSTTHRVVNPTGERARRPRYSMPFFLHFNSDFPIATLPGCVTPGRPNRYPQPILADDYLRERLREIKLL